MDNEGYESYTYLDWAKKDKNYSNYVKISSDSIFEGKIHEIW